MRNQATRDFLIASNMYLAADPPSEHLSRAFLSASCLRNNCRHMQAPTTLIAAVIRAIGRDDFARSTARSLLEVVKFDLTAVVLHRRAGRPVVLFDNFDAAGARTGIENYVSVTHVMNPILRYVRREVCVVRARDFTVRSAAIADAVRPYVVRSADEEMGFRTLGWPNAQEEIGLYLPACGAVVEMSFYRDRGRCAVPTATLGMLSKLGAPLAAAFETHAAVAPNAPAVSPIESWPLSPREAQIAELMLAGCSSDAIALRLDISRHTVKDHRKRIFRKLGVASLAELFARERRIPSREG
jgi:DNA-binding CsgD family transcriptional regulator